MTAQPLNRVGTKHFVLHYREDVLTSEANRNLNEVSFIEISIRFIIWMLYCSQEANSLLHLGSAGANVLWLSLCSGTDVQHTGQCYTHLSFQLPGILRQHSCEKLFMIWSK